MDSWGFEHFRLDNLRNRRSLKRNRLRNLSNSWSFSNRWRLNYRSFRNNRGNEGFRLRNRRSLNCNRLRYLRNRWSLKGNRLRYLRNRWSFNCRSFRNRRSLNRNRLNNLRNRRSLNCRSFRNNRGFSDRGGLRNERDLSNSGDFGNLERLWRIEHLLKGRNYGRLRHVRYFWHVKDGSCGGDHRQLWTLLKGGQVRSLRCSTGRFGCGARGGSEYIQLRPKWFDWRGGHVGRRGRCGNRWRGERLCRSLGDGLFNNAFVQVWHCLERASVRCGRSR